MIGSALHGAIAGILLAAGLGVAAQAAQDPPSDWKREWPDTDFSASHVQFGEIMSGGPPKDGIPAIDRPRFVPANAADGELHTREPVMTLIYRSETRAYPIRYLMWHEIVNDEIGGEPVVVTFCPLCNAGLVFKAMVNGRKLTFGVTGKLRNSDLIMYDRETESWWQQYEGRAIIGDYAEEGAVLEQIPVAIESWAAFLEREGDNKLVLKAQDPQIRPYGNNPYRGYDSLSRPFLYSGDLSALSEIGLKPLDRVVRVGGHAWPLERVREDDVIREEGFQISWTSRTHASALDTAAIAEGRPIPSILVEDEEGNPVAHEIVFAFVFLAFQPDGKWQLGGGSMANVARKGQ